MPVSVIVSTVLHGLLVAFVVFGLPALHAPKEFKAASVPVRVISASEFQRETRRLPEPKQAQQKQVRTASERRPVQPVQPKPQAVTPKPAEPRTVTAAAQEARPVPPKPEVARPAPPKPVETRTALPKPVEARSPTVAQQARPVVAPAQPPPPKVAEARTPEPRKAPTPPPAPEPPKVAAVAPSPAETKAKTRPEPPRPRARPKEPEPPPEPPTQTAEVEKPPEKKVDEFAALTQQLSQELDRDTDRPSFASVAAAVGQPAENVNVSEAERAAIGEVINEAMGRCWSPPPGAPKAEDLKIAIRVVFNPDGSINGMPEIMDQARYRSDPFYRAAADAAQRALIRCQGYDLRRFEFAKWRTMILDFDPEFILG